MRINRNTRRSARPVFRSVNSNRRRAVNSARRRMLNSGRQRLNSAVAGDIVTFNELNEAQKQSAIGNIWNTKGAEWIYESFNEDIMDQYRYDIDELASQYNAQISKILGYDYEINTDKLYWQSNSQGPYPEWRLSEIFDECSLEWVNTAKTVKYSTPSYDGKPPVEYVDIKVDGRSTDIRDDDVYLLLNYYSVEDEDWLTEYGADLEGEFRTEYGVPETIINKVDALINLMHDFIEKVWTLVEDVCRAYPDDEYAYDLYDANDWGDFEVIDDQTAEYYNDYPEDDFNTYL